jgi:hypothetical protein
MGAFQTGFQIGSSAAQAALDRREREERIKREEEERKLRLRQLELGIAEAERRAENNRRADAIDAEIVRGVGLDPGPAGVPQRVTTATTAAGPTIATAEPDAATGSSAGRSWIPLPVSPSAPPARRQADGQIDLGSPGASSMLPSAMPAPWEEMTPEQQAQWYRENPRMAAITRGLQYAWLNGTGVGRLQRMVDPVGVGRAVAIADKDVGFFRPEGARMADAAPSTPSNPGGAPGAVTTPVAPQRASPISSQEASPSSSPSAGPSAAAEPARTAAAAAPARYSDKAMNLFRMADSARLRGDRAQFQSLFEKGQEQVIDDVVNDFRRGYDGAEAQVGKGIEYLNATSAGITIGEPDPKTGVRQASIVQPDKKALFMRLSRADQAELWAASQLMQTNPERAFRMIAGVNKTLAEVVKAETEQARALMSANNQAVAFGANVRRDQASVDNMERDDKRAVAATAKAESDAKAKSDAAVALYRQRNPNATEVELEAVRRGVVSAVPTAKVESSFTPNPLGGGGTVTQRMPDGTLVITPVDRDGKPGTPSTVNAPGAAAARGSDTRGVDPGTADASQALAAITTARLEEAARNRGLPVDEVVKQLAAGMGVTPDALRAAVYANDARAKQGAGPSPTAAASASTPTPAAPVVTPAAPAAGAVTPGVDLGPPRIPARPVVQSVPASTAPTSTPDSTPQAQAAAPIQMSFTDASVASVAAAVSVASGRRIEVDSAVKQKITLSADVMESPEQAFQRFLSAVRQAGLTVNFGRSGAVYITKRSTPAAPASR